MVRPKRKQRFLINVDEDVRRKLDKIKEESPNIRLSYNDIIILALWEYQKKQD